MDLLGELIIFSFYVSTKTHAQSQKKRLITHGSLVSRGSHITFEHRLIHFVLKPYQKVLIDDNIQQRHNFGIEGWILDACWRMFWINFRPSYFTRPRRSLLIIFGFSITYTHRIMCASPQLTTFVPSEVIRQWFSREMQSDWRKVDIYIDLPASAVHDLSYKEY